MIGTYATQTVRPAAVRLGTVLLHNGHPYTVDGASHIDRDGNVVLSVSDRVMVSEFVTVHAATDLEIVKVGTGNLALLF